MSSLSRADLQKKFREERIAREKARFEKLRELNLKKYNINDTKASKESVSATHVIRKPSKSDKSNKLNIKPKTLQTSSKLPAAKRTMLTQNLNQDQKAVNNNQSPYKCLNLPKIKPTPVSVPRSITTVYLESISKDQLPNCTRKWSSVGDNLNKVSLQNINKDENVRPDRILSAVMSDRNKVTFQTPRPNFNTPKPDELKRHLKNWLKERGKSLDSVDHLQYFAAGDNLDQKEIEPLSNRVNDLQIQHRPDKWREEASDASSSVDLNDSHETTLSTGTNEGSEGNVEEVMVGALSDLTKMLKEGFDWEQSACWLLAIRERFPNASDTAAYWECRAALEETRGNIRAYVYCWEQATNKGTKCSVGDANLDKLLNKFEQLKISPSGSSRQPDPKLLDVTKVFKSTLITRRATV